jgi:hypothetical protein
MEKLDEYYQRTAASDAHIMAMGKIGLIRRQGHHMTCDLSVTFL